MLRQTIILAVAGLAIAATPALAACQWHSQMKDGSATSARATGACSVGAGSHAGSLRVTCASHHSASLTYLFAGAHGVKGQPTAGVAAAGGAKVQRTVKVTGSDIEVTVTVSGGSAQLNSVSVGYYAH
jgi:hypothetical protein